MRFDSRYPIKAAFVAVVLLIQSACQDAPTAPSTQTLATRPAFSGSVPLTGIPTGKTVIVFRDSSSVPLAGLALVTGLGGVITSRFDEVGVVFAAGISAMALTQLRANNLVFAAGNDVVRNWLPTVQVRGVVDAGALGGGLTHNDPWLAAYYADGTQWGPRIMQADLAWHAGYQGSPNVRVAILDTGIDYTNRELVGLVDLGSSTSFSSLVTGADTIELSIPIEPQLPGDAPYMDNHFHGTHVASTVASNNISVAGIAPDITLVAVKVLNFQGSATFESVATGIRYAAGAANADVINMSLGANVEPAEDGVPALLEMMRRVIAWAEKQGTIVISAAGNDALNLDAGSVVSTPCEQSTVCVSATGPLLQQNFDQPATYTNYGITAIEVAAPGGNAVEGNDSAYVNEDLIIGACSTRTTEPGLAPCRASTEGVAYFYAFAAGTSMATPHVSGEAALIRSRWPGMSVKAVRDRLLKTADDVGVPGKDGYSNWGRVNAWRAVR